MLAAMYMSVHWYVCMYVIAVYKYIFPHVYVCI